MGKSAQKNPPGRSPAKSSKFYTTKILRHISADWPGQNLPQGVTAGYNSPSYVRTMFVFSQAPSEKFSEQLPFSVLPLDLRTPPPRKNTKNGHIWYFGGIFSVFSGYFQGQNSGSPEFRAGGYFFGIFCGNFGSGHLGAL